MTTEERLAKVERELAETKAQAERAKRRTRAGLVGMGLIAAVSVLGLIGAHGCEPGEGGGRLVHARAFFLEDENGRVRAMLAVLPDGPGLALYDAAGTCRATLGAGKTVMPDGKTITYPESSLLLSGADGKVIWSAP